MQGREKNLETSLKKRCKKRWWLMVAIIHCCRLAVARLVNGWHSAAGGRLAQDTVNTSHTTLQLDRPLVAKNSLESKRDKV